MCSVLEVWDVDVLFVQLEDFHFSVMDERAELCLRVELLCRHLLGEQTRLQTCHSVPRSQIQVD